MVVNEVDQKMKELILYIAQKSEGDLYFGATKLNKLLFFSDFLSYLLQGESITTQEYQCLEHGPAPRKFVPIRDDLIKSGEAILRKTDFFGKTQNQLIGMRPPNMKLFTGEEIALVDHVIDQFRNLNASEISFTSHQFIGWQYTEEGETIPYEMALVSPRDLSILEWEYGDRIPLPT